MTDRDRKIAALSGKLIGVFRAHGVTSVPVEQIPEFMVGIIEICAEEYAPDVPAILLAADTAEPGPAGPWRVYQSYGTGHWGVQHKGRGGGFGLFTKTQAIGIRNLLNRDAARTTTTPTE